MDARQRSQRARHQHVNNVLLQKLATYCWRDFAILPPEILFIVLRNAEPVLGHACSVPSDTLVDANSTKKRNFIEKKRNFIEKKRSFIETICLNSQAPMTSRRLAAGVDNFVPRQVHKYPTLK
ncbi:hypothetical protein FB451DRAFT_1408584 [Mycena latifolia]|nr:hypothetical protein FB451DRAFT_1408584 [Mycena latifolia]